MATLYFPALSFVPGENVTVRLGGDWADLFNNGVMEAEIKQLGSQDLYAIADIGRVDAVPFSLVQQGWIDQASYPTVTNIDELYNYLSLFYGAFDCDAVVSVIYFTLRP